ncbi:MAG: KCU-star family selenoprotein [Helicobacter sp.]|nr:KCU-star family selenoprotein [Helicobacter sp.]MDE7176096.1 KCU-star family selenoprotein [Helicobacter sp.]
MKEKLPHTDKNPKITKSIKVWLEAFASNLIQIYRRSDRFFHLLVGMPSYDKYVEHMRQNHPDKIPKSQREFFKEAMEAKYGAGRNKC